MKREHKLKIIALILTIALWYFIVWGKPIEKTIEIPIEYFPLKRNYLIEINPANAQLKVLGTRSSFRNFNQDSLKFVLDISKYPSGVYQVRLPIEKLNLPSEVKVKEITPSFITLVVKKIITKDFPVEIVFEEELERSQKNKILVVPSYVKVRGTVDGIYNINAISTEPVSFSKLVEYRELEIKLVTPPEVIEIKPERVKIFLKEVKKGGKDEKKVIWH
ncbi:MAG: hypothetical protein NZ530_03035 [Thermodesulfobacteriaceae bacterium]|nr:hypothetical protein [Thermodesulfobacteriaceae bacterium]MCX8042122.1 hypothetical protein [Thermodesulfobacteriaceae bacterium]MDW8135744.1 hypothetical protein [Thermodesulfobacterium sp.]